MKYTFKGGIHPKGNKITADCRVRVFKKPKILYIPMIQHIGAPCTPTVKKGDRVLTGQIIGTAPSDALSAPVHSSVSGTVTGIMKIVSPNGASVEHVVVENDFKYEVSPDVKSFSKKLADATTEDIIDVVKRAGIVGMGGAGFPTFAKLKSSVGKATTVIINCVECEPYLTSNYRLMVERPKEIVGGTKILMKALGVHNAVFAVEDNKPLAVKKLREATSDSDMMSVVVMKTKYPQGDERRIIDALTKREVGRGKLPSDVGCVLFNAETVSAVYTAFASGLPSVYRIVTVSGSGVAFPSNVLVPIGTSIRELVDFCGGLYRPVSSVINGGPMMGNAMYTPDAPITKTTSGIILFGIDEANREFDETACIRCGKCVRACPSRIMPCFIANSVKENNMEDADFYGALDCVECGSCAYVCPARIPLVQYIKIAKNELKKKK